MSKTGTIPFWLFLIFVSQIKSCQYLETQNELKACEMTVNESYSDSCVKLIKEIQNNIRMSY